MTRFVFYASFLISNLLVDIKHFLTDKHTEDVKLSSVYKHLV